MCRFYCTFYTFESAQLSLPTFHLYYVDSGWSRETSVVYWFNVVKIVLVEVWALALKLQCLYQHSFRKSRINKGRIFSEIIFGCMPVIVLNLYDSCCFTPFVLFILIIWFLILMFKVDLTAYVEKHEFCFDAVLNEHVTNDEVTCLHSYGV